MFTLWPQSGRIWLGFWFGNWKRFYGVSEERAQAIMGPARERAITEANVADFIERLDRLFEEINAARTQ